MDNFLSYLRYVRWRPWGTIAWTLFFAVPSLLLAWIARIFWIPFALALILPIFIEGIRLFVRSRRVTVLRYHKGPVTSLLWTKEGGLLSAGEDGFLRHYPSGKMAKGHAKAAWLAIDADGETLLSAGLDGKVKRWKAADLSRIDVAMEGEKGICALAVGNDVLTALEDGTLRGTPLGRRIDALAVHPDGHLIAAAVDGGVLLWEPSNGEPRRLATELGSARGVSFSPDGLHVASGGGPLRIWSIEDGSVVADLPARAATRAVYSPSGKFVASEMDVCRESVGLWDAADGALVREFFAAHPVTALAISRDESRLAAGTEDGAVLIWNV